MTAPRCLSSPAACIKSIDARLNKLRKKYSDNEIKDIRALEELKSALENITPSDFSRYQQLLTLLKDKEYGKNKNKGENTFSNDRIYLCFFCVLFIDLQVSVTAFDFIKRKN